MVCAGATSLIRPLLAAAFRAGSESRWKAGSLLVDFLVAEHAVEGPGPGSAVRLLAQTVRLQQIPQLAVSADNAECDMAKRKRIVMREIADVGPIAS
jgi:hypothetical protein